MLCHKYFPVVRPKKLIRYAAGNLCSRVLVSCFLHAFFIGFCSPGHFHGTVIVLKRIGDGRVLNRLCVAGDYMIVRYMQCDRAQRIFCKHLIGIFETTYDDL